MTAARLDIGAKVSIGEAPVGIIIGFHDDDPILRLNGNGITVQFSRDAIDCELPSDFDKFKVGAKVDSSYIRLFKRLNRGEVISVHTDGMMMIRWDREGECLHHASELRRITSIWDHLKHG